jgi:hypothetical protein
MSFPPTVSATPSPSATLGGSTPTHTAHHEELRSAVAEIVAEIQAHEALSSSVHGITAAGKALVDDADAAAQRVTLGLVIGTNVQAQDAELQAIAGLTSAENKLPYFSGSGAAALADLSAAGRALIDDADAAAQRATLSAAGTGVENTFSEDQILASGKFFYLGPKDSDGSWRFATSGTGLVFQCRESGNWITKQTVEA